MMLNLTAPQRIRAAHEQDAVVVFEAGHFNRRGSVLRSNDKYVAESTLSAFPPGTSQPGADFRGGSFYVMFSRPNLRCISKTS